MKPENLGNFDAILIGTPNHVGGPVGKAKKLIKQLGKMNLNGKKVAFFDTYMGKDYQKAVKKMENSLSSSSASGAHLITPGLSIRVEGMRGPIAEGELDKCTEFGGRIAAQIKA